MILFLAFRNLFRTRTRTLLVWLGITVSGALLYDMVMLAGGLDLSFASLLRSVHFDLRMTPRGSLPFGGEAVLSRSEDLVDALSADPRVASLHRFYGCSVYWSTPARPGMAAASGSAFALGTAGPEADLFRFEHGDQGRAGAQINRRLAQRGTLRPGDTLVLSASPPGETRRGGGSLRLPVAALGEFRFESSRETTLQLPLEYLWALRGVSGSRPYSMLAVRLHRPGEAAGMARELRTRFPGAEVYEVHDILARARAQLSYFTQFSNILGSMSFLVAWLLVSTLLVLSLNDRVGECAVLRAVGFRSSRLVWMMLAESLAYVAVSIPSALLLGTLTGHYLDELLRRGPGLPSEVHFFVATPGAALRTAALLLLAGALGALGPMVRISRLPIASTLHEAAS